MNGLILSTLTIVALIALPQGALAVDLGPSAAAFWPGPSAPSAMPASPVTPAPPAPPEPLKAFSISAEAGEGALVVNCDPEGAEVSMDGVLIGEAPIRKERIKEGVHTLTMKKPGYETSADKITIKKDVTLTVWEKMEQASGEITVGSEPPGAAVVLDGLAAGTTPATLKRVTGGRHTVTLRRDYFEPQEFVVDLEAGRKREIHAGLKRRLLFVGLSEGAQTGGMGPELDDLAKDMQSGMGGIEVIPTGMDKLTGELVSRGLDPSALDFMKRRRSRLDLEDVAVLSDVLEQERAELALVALLSGDGTRRVLSLTLYSIAGSAGDRTEIVSETPQGLEAGFMGYLEKWSRQEKAAHASIGARLVDRAEGGLEVETVLPGSPASAAGLVPGDRITRVDGASCSGKDSFLSRLWPGTEQLLSVTGRDGCRTVKITPINSPAETPPGSGDCLYNLVLVDYAGLPASDPIAALNLGNVYAHMGEYDKAVNAYKLVRAGNKTGICAGTALYRLGQAYEKLMLWVDAAGAYRKAMMLYPDATIEDAEGPSVAALARERLKALYSLGLVDERWWL